MHLLIGLLKLALDVYFWIIILWVTVSWLINFSVLNTRNKWVGKFCFLLNRAIDPVTNRLRRVVPPIGGIDLTPMVMIFVIYFLQYLLANLDMSLSGPGF